MMEEKVKRSKIVQSLSLVAAVLLIATVSVTACAPAKPTEQFTLRIGNVATMSSLPYFVMQERGFDEKNGLQLTETVLPSGESILNGIADGSLDIGFTGSVPALTATERGMFPGKMLVVMANTFADPQHPGSGVLVGASVASWQDLKGQQIAVQAKNSLQGAAIKGRLLKEGVSDYTLVEITFPNQGLAVAGGNVAAAAMSEPYLTQSLLRGDGKLLGRVIGGPPFERMEYTMTVCSSSLYNNNPQAVKAFLRAHLQAVQWINNNPADARLILTRRLNLSPEIGQKIKLLLFSVDGHNDPALLESMQSLLIDVGVLKAPIPVNQLYDETLLNEMRGMKLSVKLPMLIVLSVFVSALIIFGLGAYVTRNSLRAVEMEANSNSAHAYADAASFYLEQARSTLETAAALPQITEFASAGLVDPALHGVPADAAISQRNVAASILKNSKVFECIMLINADGTIYLLEPYELQVKALRGNLAFRNWYQELMSGGGTVMSDLLISNATQRPTVAIATPVRSSAGQVIGILAGELKLEAFSQMARGESETGTPQRYGEITDSRGLIIAHQANPKYVQEQTDFSVAPPVRAALAGQDGTMQFVSPIGRAGEIGGYMPLPGTGWAVVYLVPTQVAFAPLTRLMYTTLFITVVIAIIAAIVGLAIIRQTTKRLGQLTAAATVIGSGDLSQRVKVTTGDELGQLGTEFNRMAVSLSEKEVQLRDYAAQLEQKVEERTVELTRSNADLAQFAYAVSHDLRAPLRGIDGFSQALLEDYPDKLDEQGKEYLQRVRSGTQRMGELIDDMLNLSRVTRSEMRRETVDLSTLATKVTAELQKTQPGRQVEFVITEGLTVNGDTALLRAALENLFGNAWKFTGKQPKARIEFGVTLHEDKPAYYIRDDGVGFDMTYVGKLFAPFQRLHSAEEFPGTGIGLATVQRIILRHGGTVWAEGAVGKGATFYFTFNHS